MNRLERLPGVPREAVVEFLDSDFHVVSPGSFVRCAVTGLPIPLESLKYWSAARQEAYSGPEAALTRHREVISKG
jgi:hypothetical protein